MSAEALRADLASLVGDRGVADDVRPYARDATRARGLEGRPDAVVLPQDTAAVAAVMAFCYARGIQVVPRGGGTGLAGGAVPVAGGVVLSLERLRAVRAFDPGLWRMHVEAGLSTRHVQRLAREGGLWFPPDPGAADESHIGGNIAANAGGPHAFKYGVTGRWVTGLEAVVPPGEVVRVGGPLRKDVAGYDLLSLLVGSEGTLGVVTAAWLRLIPAPEAQLPLVATCRSVADGCAAIEAVLASGVLPSVLEYLDEGALRAARGTFPGSLPEDAAFLVIAEADGTPADAARARDELVAAVAPTAAVVHAPATRWEVEALWRWREGVPLAVGAQRGGEVCEDVAVPLDRLAEAIEGVIAIAAAHRLEGCSWGHAGDGNLHATFVVPCEREALDRAEGAAEDVFALAVRLGGTVSGEHGVGVVKGGQLRHQWPPAAVRLHRQIKQVFDPEGLLNPQKKLP